MQAIIDQAFSLLEASRADEAMALVDTIEPGKSFDVMPFFVALAGFYLQQKRADLAEVAIKKAEAFLDRIEFGKDNIALENFQSSKQTWQLICQILLSGVLAEQDRTTEAGDILSAVAEKLVGDLKAGPLLGQVLVALAELKSDEDHIGSAETLHRAVAALTSTFSLNDPRLGVVLLYEAASWLKTDKPENATSILHQALGIFVSQFGSNHPLCAEALDLLALGHMRAGRLKQARALAERALAIYAEVAESELGLKWALAANILASIYALQEKRQKASDLFSQILTVLAPFGGSAEPFLAMVKQNQEKFTGLKG